MWLFDVSHCAYFWGQGMKLIRFELGNGEPIYINVDEIKFISIYCKRRRLVQIHTSENDTSYHIVSGYLEDIYKSIMESEE